MTHELRQSTCATFAMGPFLDEDDGKSVASNLSIEAGSIRVIKNGSDFGATTAAQAGSHDEKGYFLVKVDATDTGTLGRLRVAVHMSGSALPVWRDFNVVAQNYWDTKYSTDRLQVDVRELGDSNLALTTQMKTDVEAEVTDVVGASGASLTAIPWNSAWDAEVESEVDDSLVAHNLDHLALTATAAADMTTEVADNTILSRILANGNTSDFVPSTDGLQLIRDKQTDIETDTAEIGAAGAGLTAVPWNAAWDAEVESEVQDVIGASGASLTAIPWNSAWDAEVESEVDDSLEAHNLDHLALTATGAADMTSEVADNTILSRILANGDTSAFVPSTDGLQLIRDKQTDIETDTAEIGAAGAGLTAVPWNAAWDAEVQSEVQDVVGASGASLTAIPWNSAWDAEVESEANDALVAQKLDHLVAVADNDDAVDNSLIAKLASSDADWSGYDNTTDSLEALRDRGDAAWITGAGGGITDLLNIQTMIPNAIDLANTATVRIGLGLTNMLDNLPTTTEIDPGTIDIHRKAIGGTSWVAIVSGSACSEVTGLVYLDEVFDTGTGYAAGDTIRITFKNQKITVAANDYEITGSDGWMFHTYIRTAMRGTDSAALASVATEARLAELDAGNLPSDIDDILADTAEIGASGAGLLAVPWNAAWDAEVQSEVADAIVAYNLDHLLLTATGGADMTTEVADNTILSRILAGGDTSAFVPSTDGLQPIRDKQTDIETDTQNIQGRLPASLTSGRMSANAEAISGSTDAADKLEASAETIVVGAAAAGTLSTTQMSTDLSEATDDHYNGRIIIWTSGVLLAQATNITDYDGTNKILDYTATTEAPSDGDTFVIV